MKKIVFQQQFPVVKQILPEQIRTRKYRENVKTDAEITRRKILKNVQ